MPDAFKPLFVTAWMLGISTLAGRLLVLALRQPISGLADAVVTMLGTALILIGVPVALLVALLLVEG